MSIASDNTVTIDSLRIDIRLAARELEGALDVLRHFASVLDEVDPARITEAEASMLPHNVRNQFATVNQAIRRMQGTGLTAVLRAGQVKAAKVKRS